MTYPIFLILGTDGFIIVHHVQLEAMSLSGSVAYGHADETTTEEAVHQLYSIPGITPPVGNNVFPVGTDGNVNLLC